MNIYKISILFACIISGVIVAHKGQILAPGVVYYHKEAEEPFALSLHLLKVNPEYAQIMLEASHGTCCGAEKTSQIAQRTQAIAAINGSFFDFGQ